MTPINERLRVLLIENDGGTINSVRIALENDPELEFIGYLTSRSQVARHLSNDVPTIALVDIGLMQLHEGMRPHRSVLSFEEGLETISLIKNISPTTRIIGFSEHFINQPILVKEALQRGADALLAKQNGPSDWKAWCSWLRSQIMAVIDGWFEFSPEVAKLIEEDEQKRRVETPDDPLPLTERQMEVLHLLASGLRDEQIAQMLCIVAGAVRGHITNIKYRLHMRYRWEVIEEARRRGMGKPTTKMVNGK